MGDIVVRKTTMQLYLEIPERTHVWKKNLHIEIAGPDRAEAMVRRDRWIKAIYVCGALAKE